jgi:hypothetical protein
VLVLAVGSSGTIAASNVTKSTFPVGSSRSVPPKLRSVNVTVLTEGWYENVDKSESTVLTVSVVEDVHAG